MLDRLVHGGGTAVEDYVDGFGGVWALNEKVFVEHAEALKNIVRITGE